MKKWTALFLAVTLLTALVSAAPAEGSGGAFEITEITRAFGGALKVAWTDPEGNAPYQVLFQPASAENEDAPTNNLIVWGNSGEVSGTEYTEHSVVPDWSWWFVVQDSAGRQAVKKYEPGEKKESSVRSYEPLYAGAEYDDAQVFDVGMIPQARTKRGSSYDYKDLGSGEPAYFVKLSEEDILAADDAVSYGVRVRFVCRDPGAVAGETLAMKYALSNMLSGNFPMVISYTDPSDPGGYYAFSGGYNTLEAFIPLSPFVKRMNRITGSAGGMYQLCIYANGQRAWTLELSIH